MLSQYGKTANVSFVCDNPLFLNPQLKGALLSLKTSLYIIPPHPHSLPPTHTHTHLGRHPKKKKRPTMHQQLRKQTREINDLNSLDSTLRVIFASFSPPHAISNFSGKDLRNMIFWRIKLYKKKKDTILSMKYMV